MDRRKAPYNRDIPVSFGRALVCHPSRVREADVGFAILIDIVIELGEFCATTVIKS